MRHVEDSLWSRWQQRRSERAFEQLVQPHLRFLRGFARRLGCTSADADDVVQKTLVRLAGDRTRKPAEVGLRAWLGRTVLSEAKMAFRARKRRRRHERRAPVHLPPGLDAVDERDEVEVALRGLREGERRAIVLRFLHDLDYDEVAHILGTTRRAARLRVHRGLARLRKRLGPRALACLAALPLLGGRAAARQQSVRAALHEAATASGATSVSTLAGAFVMTTTAKLSLGVCAALVASLLVWQAASRPRDSVKRAGRGSATNSREQQQQPVESAPAVSEPPASSTGRDHARTFPDKPIPPGKGCVIGRVVVSGGRAKRTDAKGRFVLEWVPEGGHGVWTFVGRPGLQRVWIDVHGSVPVDLREVEIPPGGMDLGELPVRAGSRIYVHFAVPAGMQIVRIVSVERLGSPQYSRGNHPTQVPWKPFDPQKDPVIVQGLGPGRFRLFAWVKGGPLETIDEAVQLDGVHDLHRTLDLR